MVRDEILNEIDDIMKGDKTMKRHMCEIVKEKGYMDLEEQKQELKEMLESGCIRDREVDQVCGWITELECKQHRYMIEEQLKGLWDEVYSFFMSQDGESPVYGVLLTCRYGQIRMLWHDMGQYMWRSKDFVEYMKNLLIPWARIYDLDNERKALWEVAVRLSGMKVEGIELC